MKKILIIQLKQLGDIIATTPVIDVLYKKFAGDVQIDFLVEKNYTEVLTENPYLTKIYSIDKNDKTSQFKIIRQLRAEKYDYVFDFFCNPRSAWISFFSGGKLRYGYDYRGRKFFYNRVVARDRNPRNVIDFKMDLLKDLGIESGLGYVLKTSFYLDENVVQKMHDYLLENGWDGKQKVLGLVVPNVRPIAVIKNWIFERYIELANRVQTELGAFVVVLWGPGEYENAKIIKSGLKLQNQCMMNRELSIKELAGLIKNCSVIFSGCAGPKQIAVALDVPTVTIFGPTHEISWNPANSDKNISLIARQLKCLGCNKNVCEDQQCMKLITTDIAFDAVARFLVF